MTGRPAVAVPALLTLAAVAASVGAALLGGRLIASGPNWWQSLVARPYLAFAEMGIDMGHPGFWILPTAALLAGGLWAYAITRALGVARLRPTILAALAFGTAVTVEAEATPWWVASVVPPEDGREGTHLLLGIAESVFVVAAISSGVLSLGVGLGRRAIRVAIVVGICAAAGASLVYIALDTLGVRVGTGDSAMVKVTILSTAAGAMAGGAALGRSIARPPQPTQPAT
jgi:hypothetical protein